MKDPRGFAMRSDGSQYLALPDGHRTTLVVGMIDMLELMVTHVTSDERRKFDTTLAYARQFESDKLRYLLDDYVNGDMSRQKYAVASSFLAALLRKCGY